MKVSDAAVLGSLMGIFGYYLGRFSAQGMGRDEAVIKARIELLKQTGGHVPSEREQNILDGMIKFVESENGFKEDDDE